MNIKEYIASGKLESYALGDLDAQERTQVENDLLKYPELREELDKIELTMEALLMKAATPVADSLKGRIMASVQAHQPEAAVVPIQQRVMIWKYATAASVALAVASSVLAIVFWMNWKRTETDLIDRIAMSERMAADYETVNNRMDKIESDMKIYDNPKFTKVVMKGTANDPEAMASVYWSRTTQEVYVSMQNMKSLTRENQFQLWAIVDGKPVDLGVFDGDARGLVKMKLAERASAFAVTIEPRGGRPSPTMANLQVIGNT